MSAPTARTAHRGAPTGARQAGALLARVPQLLLVSLVRVYQSVISPLTGPTCRYYPSCSQYALVALQRHGVLRGSWLAARRLGRCHPWTPGGVDDVPPARHTEASTPGDGLTTERGAPPHGHD